MGNVVVAPPNEVAIITGCRGEKMLIGSCGMKFWVVESVNRLSLEIMTLTISSHAAETIKGVQLNIHSVAQVKC